MPSQLHIQPRGTSEYPVLRQHSSR